MHIRLLVLAAALAFAAGAHAQLREFSQAGTLKIDAGSAQRDAARRLLTRQGRRRVEHRTHRARSELAQRISTTTISKVPTRRRRNAHRIWPGRKIRQDRNHQHCRGLVCAGAAAIVHVRRQPAFAPARIAGKTAGRDWLRTRETRVDANGLRQGNAQARRNVRVRYSGGDAAARRCRNLPAGRQIRRLTGAVPNAQACG